MMSLVQAEPIVCSNFVTMATRVIRGKNVNDTNSIVRPRNPLDRTFFRQLLQFTPAHHEPLAIFTFPLTGGAVIGHAYREHNYKYRVSMPLVFLFPASNRSLSSLAIHVACIQYAEDTEAKR